MASLERAKGTPVFDVWMQAIRAKITSDADAVLELYGTETDWEDIKSTLTTHFSDKRDEISLTRDLFKITQTGDVQEFYGNVSHSISLLVNRLNLNEPNPVVVAAKKDFYQQLGLKVFLSGLREPLGPIIRAQAPKTLKEGLRLCLEESNYNYVKNPYRIIPQIPMKTLPVPPRNQSNFLQQQRPLQVHQPLNRFLLPQQQRFFPHQQRPFQSPQQQRTFQFSQQRPSHFLQQRPFQFSQQRPFQFSQSQRPLQFGHQPQRQFQSSNFPPKQNFTQPIPMEVDQSIRSKQVNYMNRNPPNFQIEEQRHGVYYDDQIFQGCEQNFPDESYQQILENQIETSSKQPKAETQENESSTQVDDLNFQLPATDYLPT